jgi:hypothetical protein
MYHSPKYIKRLIVGVLVCSAILTACGSSTLVTISTSPPIATTELETPTNPPPEIETPSPTPILTQSLVVFVSPPDANPAASEQIASTLSDLAATEGLEFEQRQSFTMDDLSAEIKILAAFGQDPGLDDMAQSAPAIQFLGISIPGLQPAPNITVIDNQGFGDGDIGFLAGYLAAVVSPEWRMGTISISDTSGGQNQRLGFLNGAVFFCGLCRQIYPPFLNYPLYSEAPAASTQQEWLAAAEILIDSAVDTAYIAPGAGDNTLYEYLAGAGINLLGTTTPPPGLEENWIGTIGGDFQSSVRAAWPDLLADQGGSTHPIQLTINHINPELFSPGRQQLVNKMIAELSAGFIDTGVGSDAISP